MKTFRFKSIRTRLTYWFLTLSIIPLLATILIIYQQRVSAIESSTFDKLLAIRDLKVSRLNAWLDERVGDIKTLINNNELKDIEHVVFESSNTIDQKTIVNHSRKILNDYLLNHPVYNELFILNPITGEVIVSTHKYLEGEYKGEMEYFRKPLETGNLHVSDISYSAQISGHTMTYSLPILCRQHEDEHIVGILVTRVDLHNSLYKLLLDRAGLGETGETLIVNQDVVALNQLRWHENAPLNLNITAEPAVRAARGETGIAETKDYRDEPILAAYTYLPDTKWGFVCKQDLRELNAPIREMFTNFIILFILSVIAISLIAVFISRSFTKPIFAMHKVAQRIKAGDFSVRNLISSEDELGLLALEFNHMADITVSKIKVQEGIADISNTMIGKTEMRQFSLSLLKRLMKITNADMSTFYILNDETAIFENFSSVGANNEMLKPFSSVKPEGEFGNVISTKGIYHLKELSENTIFKYRTVAGDLMPQEIITIPIIVDDVIVALISLVNIQKFNADSLEILKQSWPNINTSYSNLIAGERTKILAEHLSSINQQLEAQSEELQHQTEELQSQTEELQSQTEELTQTTDSLERQNIELEKQRKQVESANQLKSEFLANMSHELRTPLNSIMALSSVLIMRAKNKLNDEENDYLKIVERNGKRLLTLINDILDLSKIEAGKMDVQPKLISLDGLIQTINENIHSLSEQKGLSLKLEVQDKLPKVETDEARLHQALLNIVANAVKFTDEGDIEISVKYDKKNVFIDVKDSGIGIAPEVLPHIFDEFRQADSTTSKQYEGTGLGLSIAKKMITILGGRIEVSSELGIGSSFTVILPQKWDHKQTDKTVKTNKNAPKK